MFPRATLPGLFRRGVWVYAPVFVLLVAFAVRFHDLDAQSLWNDEGNSLRLAQRSAGDLIDAAGRDIHPPGYYLLLKAWIALAGEREFSLRALSAFEGVLAVAAAVALGRMLFSRAAGLLAGLLVALNAFAVYYSQETRMYAQLGLLSAAGMAALVAWLRNYGWDGRDSTIRKTSRAGHRTAPASLRGWIILALINAAGLYTQYSFPFTMLAQGIIVAAWLVRAGTQQPATRRRALIDYAAANVLTLALVVPWLPTAWDQITGWPRTGEAIALGSQLRTVLTWIVYGSTAGDVVWLRFVFPAVLVIAALWPGRRDNSPWRAGILLAWGGIVVGALFVSGAYREANLKFLLPAQIAAALLVAQGAVRLWGGFPTLLFLTPREARYIRRMIAAVCLFLVVIGQMNALDALYTDPAYARDDYRAMAAHITASGGDAIILDAPNQAEVFTYYYDGGAPVYGLPRGLGGDDDQTRADVQAILEQHRRIFVLFWGEQERDPNRAVQAALDAGAYPVASWWYGDVRLAQYAVLAETPAAPDVLTDARFGAHITLTGYALSADVLRPGDVLGVTLFWQTGAPLEVRYGVTVQLLAPDGSLVTQHDAEPGNNRALTTTWTPGDPVIDPHGLIVPPDLPPGDYTVIVGLYDLNAPLDRLPVVVAGDPVGDVFTLPPLAVQ